MIRKAFVLYQRRIGERREKRLRGEYARCLNRGVDLGARMPYSIQPVL